MPIGRDGGEAPKVDFRGDSFFLLVEECLVFGVRNVRVYFLGISSGSVSTSDGGSSAGGGGEGSIGGSSSGLGDGGFSISASSGDDCASANIGGGVLISNMLLAAKNLL